jgi:hypothetical protein
MDTLTPVNSLLNYKPIAHALIASVPPFLCFSLAADQRKGRGIRVGNCLPSFYEPDGNVFTPRLMG